MCQRLTTSRNYPICSCTQILGLGRGIQFTKNMQRTLSTSMVFPRLKESQILTFRLGLFQEVQLDDAKMFIEKLTYIAKLFKQTQYGSL